LIVYYSKASKKILFLSANENILPTKEKKNKLVFFSFRNTKENHMNETQIKSLFSYIYSYLNMNITKQTKTINHHHHHHLEHSP